MAVKQECKTWQNSASRKNVSLSFSWTIKGLKWPLQYSGTPPYCNHVTTARFHILYTKKIKEVVYSYSYGYTSWGELGGANSPVSLIFRYHQMTAMLRTAVVIMTTGITMIGQVLMYVNYHVMWLYYLTTSLCSYDVTHFSNVYLLAVCWYNHCICRTSSSNKPLNLWNKLLPLLTLKLKLNKLLIA